MRQLSLPFEPEHYDERPEILVIGDAIEDIWFECDSVAISAEAPVPVVKANRVPIKFPGGAANVAANLEAMGWRVSFLHQTGSFDVWGPSKIRFMYQGRQVFRTDRNDVIKNPVDSWRLERALADASTRGLPVVVADYNKGALTDELRWLIDPRKYSGVPAWYIHTKVSPHWFTGGDSANKSITWFYNHKEISAFHNNELFFYKPIVVTKGAEGAMEMHMDSAITTCAPIPGTPRSTCGAGDVFMAAYVTAKELYDHPNPLAIADAIAKKTVCECDYTCVYRGGF